MKIYILLILASFLGSMLATWCKGADIACNGRYGYGPTVIQDNLTGGVFKVRNYTASSVTFGITNLAGVYGGGSGSVNFSSTVFKTSGGVAFAGTTGLTMNDLHNSTPTTIPALSTRYIKVTPAVRIDNPANLGGGYITWVFQKKVDGVQTTQTMDSPSILWTQNASSSTATGSGAALIGAGNSVYFGNSVSFTSTSSTFSWGQINIGSPSPPEGSITIHGLMGSYRAVLMIDGVERASGSQTAAETVMGPDIVWTTATPIDWIDSEVQLFVNNALMPERTPPYRFFVIDNNTPDVDHPDNFTYLLQPFTGTFTDDGWIYDQLHFDPDAEMEIPAPESEIDAPEQDGNSGVEVRPAPQSPASDGLTDPATDSTVDSDGAGAGVGLSVKDTYRAMRQAIEDALGKQQGSPGRFNFDEWERGEGFTDEGGGDTGAGMTGLGDKLIDGIGDMPPTMGLPLDYAGLSLTLMGTAFNIPNPPFAPWLRAFLCMWLYLFTFIAAWKLCRGAFSGS